MNDDAVHALEGVDLDDVFAPDDPTEVDAGRPTDANDNHCPICGQRLNELPPSLSVEQHVHECLNASSRAQLRALFHHPAPQPTTERATPCVCPFYKRIAGTSFTVDAFRYGAIPQCSVYFLTHFHADHYGGLSKTFSYGRIYCSLATANLVCSLLGVRRDLVHPLLLDQTYQIEDVRVTLLDANHCPGAVMILFELPNGQTILHTGDFRAAPAMVIQLAQRGFHAALAGRYSFPSALVASCRSPGDEDRLFSADEIRFSTVSLLPNGRALKRSQSHPMAQLATSMSRWLRTASSATSPSINRADEDERGDLTAVAATVVVMKDVDPNGSEDDEVAIENCVPLPPRSNNTTANMNTVFTAASSVAKTRPLDPQPSSALPRRLTILYLDTTYCKPTHAFPTQEDVLAFVRTKVRHELQMHPRTLVVVGTYQIGKERVFMTVAEMLGCKTYVDPAKRRVLTCLQDQRLNDLLTNDPASTNVHVVGMHLVNVVALKKYLAQFGERWTSVVAFRPTGWTHSQNMPSLSSIRPTVSGQVKLFGVPYSEHSSFDELRAFVTQIRPGRVIPTVNVGSERYRDEMRRHFADWLA